MEHYESESVYPAREPSGNEREKVRIESGHLVLLDQFFLVNQGVTQEDGAAPSEMTTDSYLKSASGVLLPLATGTYSIYRDPVRRIVLVYPEGRSIDLRPIPPNAVEGVPEAPLADGQTRISIERVLSEVNTREAVGTVVIETRAVALIDESFLANAEQRTKYTNLFRSGDRKEARDYLRSIGGAVRYGFNQGSDNLNVYTFGDSTVLLKAA
ncbi:MAG: hypothetical protein IT290_13190 [Deltaproteobacteria bacterium]|nr:hypothetical protein [Deltaproteobacteria bacterium]